MRSVLALVLLLAHQAHGNPIVDLENQALIPTVNIDNGEQIVLVVPDPNFDLASFGEDGSYGPGSGSGSGSGDSYGSFDGGSFEGSFGSFPCIGVDCTDYGSGKMLMFVNVSPLHKHLDETYCSMRFAMAAAGVERGEAHK